MIIDAHTHRYPADIHTDPVAWARKAGEPHWAGLVSHAVNGSPMQGFADGGKMLADMDAAGVDHAVLLGWYWEKQETCDWHNTHMQQWVSEAPERFSAFASSQPAEGAAAYDSIRRAIEEQGFTGIGEMLPQVQGYAKDNPTWHKILAWAQDNAIPVNLHVTEPVGGDYAGRVTTDLADYEWYAREFPNLKIIAAHWGGGLPFYELRRGIRKVFANVYFDTAASPLLYDPRIFQAVTDIVGSDKILFGSDYPLRLYPRRDDPDFGLADFIEEIRGAELSAETRFKILGDNARQLLGL